MTPVRLLNVQTAAVSITALFTEKIEKEVIALEAQGGQHNEIAQKRVADNCPMCSWHASCDRRV